VEGDVHSTQHLELAAKARVVGNVYYHLIEMVMGSEVNGSLCHRSSAELKPRQIGVAKAAATDKPSEAEIVDKGYVNS